MDSHLCESIFKPQHLDINMQASDLVKHLNSQGHSATQLGDLVTAGGTTYLAIPAPDLSNLIRLPKLDAHIDRANAINAIIVWRRPRKAWTMLVPVSDQPDNTIVYGDLMTATLR